jgi:hypothetical protein
VLLYVGYEGMWYHDDNQVLIMVDDTSDGISGREVPINDFESSKSFCYTARTTTSCVW